MRVAIAAGCLKRLKFSDLGEDGIATNKLRVSGKLGVTLGANEWSSARDVDNKS